MEMEEHVVILFKEEAAKREEVTYEKELCC